MNRIRVRAVMLVVLVLVGLGMADRAVSAVWVNPLALPNQPWDMGTGGGSAGADPTVIGLLILGMVCVEIFRRLRRKVS